MKFIAKWPIDLMLFVIMCAPAGMWIFTTEAVKARKSPTMYLQTRPLNDTRLAMAKISISAIIVGGSFALLVLVITAWALFGSLLYPLGPSYFLMKMTGGVPVWSMLVTALFFGWIIYWRSAVLIVVGVLGELLLLLLGWCASAMIYAFGSANNTPHMSTWFFAQGSVQPLGTMLLLAAITAILLPFVICLNERLLNWQAFIALAVVWVAANTLAAFVFLPQYYTLSRFDSWMVCLPLTLLALSPFATVPLRVHKLRHQ